MTLTAEHQRRLTAARDGLARLDGERRTLIDREAQVREDVSGAKARLDVRDEVASTLENVQHDLHARRVGRYEQLLTKLVTEVLGDDQLAVRFDLRTERGHPALDIYLERGEGRMIDPMEGSGGAVANILSLGLRLIALAAVRPDRRRRFLLLDEPDCWLAPERVPAFARVLASLARSMGHQVLVISHHTPDRWTGASVARLFAQDDTVAIEPDPDAPAWPDAETPGIREIRLRNYMSHADTVLPLGPGVTVISGDNNLGKSVFARAVRALTHGTCGDTDIRHGHRTASAEIAVENGKRVQFSRDPKRNPRQRWELIEDGAVVRSGGVEDTGDGKDVPGWAREVLKLGRVNGLDLQITHQKAPLFLLDQPASTRARVLSVGRESDHVRTMISKHGEWVRDDRRAVASGEKEIGRIEKRLQVLDRELVIARNASEEAQDLAEDARTAAERRDALHQTRATVISAYRRRLGAERRVAAYAELPEDVPGLADAHGPEGAAVRIRTQMDRVTQASACCDALGILPGKAPELHDAAGPMHTASGIRKAAQRAAMARSRHDAVTEYLPSQAPDLTDAAALHRAAGRIRDIASRTGRTRAIHDCLADLPAVPELRAAGDLGTASARIAETVRRRRELAGHVEAYDRKLAEARASLERAMNALGGVCPTCQQPATAAMILDGHQHDTETKESAHG